MTERENESRRVGREFAAACRAFNASIAEFIRVWNAQPPEVLAAIRALDTATDPEEGSAPG